MKIKTVRKMNLPELIQYVWDEQIKSTYGATQYQSNLNTVVEVDMSGQVSVHGKHYGIEVYTVPVMEEVTEDTEFCNVDVLIINKDTQELSLLNERYGSIKELLYSESYVLKTLNIFAEIDDKKQLIYSADHGIPESGVLEVNEWHV